jgi:hypothetical protein
LCPAPTEADRISTRGPPDLSGVEVMPSVSPFRPASATATAEED